MFSDGGLSRLVKNLDKAPFCTLRSHWFLRGKIPTECHRDRTDLGQWNKLPPDSGWDFPFPEAKASTPQAGNNSPLARAKNLGGSAFFHRPPVGRGGAWRDRLWRLEGLLQIRNKEQTPVSSSQPGTFCSEVSELGAAGARLAGGFPAWSWCWFRTQGWAEGWGWVSLPGPTWGWGKPSPSFAAGGDALAGSTSEGEAEEKMLSLVKRVFPVCLRPCRGGIGEPEQKPSCTARAGTCSGAHWLPTSFQRVLLQFAFLGPTRGQTSQRDIQTRAHMAVTSGSMAPLGELPVGPCCGCRGGSTASQNLPGKLSLIDGVQRTAKPGF